MSADINVNVKQETVEIINDGKTLSTDTPLAAIFDKMEQGATVEDAAKEVAQEPAKKADKPTEEPKPAPEVKKDDKPVSAMVKSLDDQFNKQEQDKIAPLVVEERNPEEVPAEELKVLPSDKPKTAKRIVALLKQIDTVKEAEATTKKELEARDAKLRELETKLSEASNQQVNTQVVDEAVKQQLEELAMFRRRYELDKDPEVKTKFDDRITSAEKPIAEILTKNGAAEPLVKMVQEEGGWLKFSQSGRKITIGEESYTAAELSELILQKIPFADRQTIQAISMEQIATKRERERFYEDQLKTANDYFKKKEESVQQGTKAHQQMLEQVKKDIDTWQKQVVLENEWLQEKKVPSDASPEQKAIIESDNANTKELNKRMVDAINAKDLKEMLSVVKDSVSYYQEKRQHARTKTELDAAKKDIEKLKAEIDNFKKGSRVTSRPGSLLVERTENKEKKGPPPSLEAALDLIASGGVLSSVED
jgi:hypothetical protein